MQAVLKDPATAQLAPELKVLFAFIEQMNSASFQLRREDIERVKAAGWSDEALYDASTVCALFNFYNKWIDATGVHDMPAELYTYSVKRLATEGYA